MNSKLEELYQKSKSLDEKVEVIENERKRREEQERLRIEQMWKRMCDDVLKLSKYSSKMDTHAPLFTCLPDAETIGFDVYNGVIRVISWKRKSIGGLYLDDAKPKTYYFSISGDSPCNIVQNILGDVPNITILGRVKEVASDWEKIYPMLEDDVTERLEHEIERKKDMIENNK